MLHSILKSSLKYNIDYLILQLESVSLTFVGLLRNTAQLSPSCLLRSGCWNERPSPYGFRVQTTLLSQMVALLGQILMLLGPFPLRPGQILLLSGQRL